MKNCLSLGESINPIHIGLSGAVWYWGGGRNQPYGHKIVDNALWMMPFDTITDIHKMSQKYNKFLPDVISGAGAGVGKKWRRRQRHTQLG